MRSDGSRDRSLRLSHARLAAASTIILQAAALVSTMPRAMRSAAETILSHDPTAGPVLSARRAALRPRRLHVHRGDSFQRSSAHADFSAAPFCAFAWRCAALLDAGGLVTAPPRQGFDSVAAHCGLSPSPRPIAPTNAVARPRSPPHRPLRCSRRRSWRSHVWPIRRPDRQHSRFALDHRISRDPPPRTLHRDELFALLVRPTAPPPVAKGEASCASATCLTVRWR